MKEVLPSILNVPDVRDFLMQIIEYNNTNISDIHEIHVDIMDGVFVEGMNDRIEDILTIKTVDMKADVHLMVENPKEKIEQAVIYGADSITIHREIADFENQFKWLLRIKEKTDIKVGVSICPETDINVLTDIIDKLDIVLIMSVNPGKGGQKYIDNSYERIKGIRDLDSDICIIVDGGINDENINKVFDCGADKVVVGSYLTSNLDDLENRLLKLQ